MIFLVVTAEACVASGGSVQCCTWTAVIEAPSPVFSYQIPIMLMLRYCLEPFEQRQMGMHTLGLSTRE